MIIPCKLGQMYVKSTLLFRSVGQQVRSQKLLEMIAKRFRLGFEPLRRWRSAVERAALKPGYSSELKNVGLSK
jgi:hypothetical protein